MKTIQEIRKERQEAEIKIAKIITDLQQSTCINVEGLKFGKIAYPPYNHHIEIEFEKI